MKSKKLQWKKVTVSDKHNNNIERQPENNDTWLSFREKMFHLCKEELIRNPSDIVIFSKGMIKNKDGSLSFPRDKKGNPIVDNREVLFNKKEGKYYGGYYCGKLLSFNTPEEAYEYANSLPFIG
jgi:hypothetical protein|nr:MAG TPA: hypothetical protein [Caudoviricetes sp.]